MKNKMVIDDDKWKKNRQDLIDKMTVYCKKPPPTLEKALSQWRAAADIRRD